MYLPDPQILLVTVNTMTVCKNRLNVLSKNDADAVATTDATRDISGKLMKVTKNEICSTNTGDSSMFNSCGYTIESRTQMVEISQFQDAQKLEVIKNSLNQYTRNMKLLLDERFQLIDMAKSICPGDDDENVHWMRVSKLTDNIYALKQEMAREEETHSI